MNKDGKIVESEEEDTIFCDVAFIYTDESELSGKIKCFANNINTYEGGMHLTGLKNIIKTKMNEYALQRKFIKKPVELMYWLDGLYAIVSVKITNPEFESQTKIKLNNSEAQDAVEKVVGDYFDKLFKDKSKQPILDAIAQHAIRVKEAEEAARRAKAIRRTSKAASKQALPGKLADCANAEHGQYAEVFLVEGQSSAGSAKTGRQPSFQAILPLRGKVLNVEKVSIDKMLKAPSIQTIIAALGCGVGKTFDVSKCRYDKILISTDADSDGF
jgi:DNA gyrase subunit B